MTAVVDWRGTPITEGCTIVYPRSSTNFSALQQMQESIVIELFESEDYPNNVRSLRSQDGKPIGIVAKTISGHKVELSRTSAVTVVVPR